MASIEEKELEDHLFNDEEALDELFGTWPGRKKYRQFNLGSYGTADIILVDPRIDGPEGAVMAITIIELKRDEVGIDTLIQAYRYKVGFIHHLKNLPNPPNLSRIEFNICLIGARINQNDWVYLGPELENLCVYEYSLSLKDGIDFQYTPMYEWKITRPKFCDSFGEKYHEFRASFNQQVNLIATSATKQISFERRSEISDGQTSEAGA